MKRQSWSVILAVLASAPLLDLPDAHACGVKLTVKTAGPKRGAKRSANPSHILLLGEPSSRLVRDLKASGHEVEVEESAEDAKRPAYGLVMTDGTHASAARKRFPGRVVAYSGDASADRDEVEKRVARSAVRTEEPRVVVARAAKPRPVAAGPTREASARVPVNSSPAVEEPAPAAPAAAAPPPAQARSTEVQRPESAKPAAEATASPARRARTDEQASGSEPEVAKAPKRGEIYFTYGRAILTTNARRTLGQTAKWLNANPDLKVTIEGHADPHGDKASNQTLSEHRADTVKEFLVESGVSAARIEVVGFGDTHLKYGNSDRRNRRAAIVPSE